MTKLLSIGNDPKTIKGEGKGYKTAIMYLAPVRLAGGHNVCPWATAGCAAACLNTAGRGGMNSVQKARIDRTKFYLNDRAAFMDQLVDEINKFVTSCERKGIVPVVRLNGTSDIAWERIPVGGRPNIMALFPEVQFYDYTKWPVDQRTAKGPLPKNYQLTYSFNEGINAISHAKAALRAGWNVAVVYDEIPLNCSPTFKPALIGRGVIDGDADDLRFLDQSQVIGLKAKGQAKKDTTGFVVRH